MNKWTAGKKKTRGGSKWLSQSPNLPSWNKFLYLAMTGFLAPTRTDWPLPFWPRNGNAWDKSCFQFCTCGWIFIFLECRLDYLLSFFFIFNYVSHLSAVFGSSTSCSRQKYIEIILRLLRKKEWAEHTEEPVRDLHLHGLWNIPQKGRVHGTNANWSRSGHNVHYKNKQWY